MAAPTETIGMTNLVGRMMYGPQEWERRLKVMRRRARVRFVADVILRSGVGFLACAVAYALLTWAVNR